MKSYYESYNKNKALYERNKKELITKLLEKKYTKGSRLILVFGLVDEYNITEFDTEYITRLSIDILDKITNYVVAYKFIN